MKKKKKVVLKGIRGRKAIFLRGEPEKVKEKIRTVYKHQSLLFRSTLPSPAGEPKEPAFGELSQLSWLTEKRKKYWRSKSVAAFYCISIAKSPDGVIFTVYELGLKGSSFLYQNHNLRFKKCVYYIYIYTHTQYQWRFLSFKGGNST